MKFDRKFHLEGSTTSSPRKVFFRKHHRHVRRPFSCGSRMLFCACSSLWAMKVRCRRVNASQQLCCRKWAVHCRAWECWNLNLHVNFPAQLPEYAPSFFTSSALAFWDFSPSIFLRFQACNRSNCPAHGLNIGRMQGDSYEESSFDRRR
jgi:hypothetical protein